MYDLGLLCVCLEIACHTVVEAHTDGDEQVALIGHHVRCEIAVHAEATHVERMVAWRSRESEESLSEWYLCLLAEVEQFLVSTSELNALTHEDEWLDRLVDHLCCLLDHALLALWHRLVRTDEIDLLRLVFKHCRLSVLGEVEHHRSWATRLGDIESASHSPCDVFGTAYLVVPLGDWLSHAHHIDLLESVGTEQRSSYLTADHHERSRIDHCVSHAGDGVHCARTRSHDDASHLATHAGISLSRMHCTLLMTHEYMIERFLMIIESIVGRHDGTSWVAKEDIHTFVLQRAHQRFCTTNFLCHYSMILTPPLSADDTDCA